MPKNKTSEEIIALIFSIGRSIRRQTGSPQEVCFLSILQMETLRYIRENKKVLMKDLAEYLHITPPSTTSIVEDLFKRGLVKRLSDKKDRRIIKISLTTRGKKLLENSLQRKLKEFRKKIEVLSSDEKKSLLKILRKIERGK
jgi:DNA-binding MarR family transcriptional regulator